MSNFWLLNTLLQQIILDLRNELKSETDEKQSALNNVLLLQSDISEAKYVTTVH